MSDPTPGQLDDSAWLSALPGGISAIVAWPGDDGTVRIASAGTDRTINIWNADRGDLVAGPLVGHVAVVSVLTTWTGVNGPRLASASEDGTIRVWDANTGGECCPPLTGHSGWVESLTTWQSADGSRVLASGGVDGTIRTWDPETGAALGPPWTGHTGTVWALAGFVSPDGTAWVASGGDDRTVRLWDTNTGHQAGSPLAVQPSAIRAVHAWYDTAGRPALAVAGADGEIGLWDPVTRRRTHRLSGHTSAVKTIGSWKSPSGTRLVTAGTDGSVRIWNPETGKAVGRPFPHPAGGEAPALAVWTGPRGAARIATPGEADVIEIWDPRTDTPIGRLNTGHVAGIWALEPFPGESGGVVLASAGGDCTVRFWNGETGGAIGAPLLGHTAALWSLTSWRSAGGRRVIASAGDDHTIRCWDAYTGAAAGDPMHGHTGWVTALISWTDGTGRPHLASAGDDATIRLWDAGNRTPAGPPISTGGSWVLSLCAWSTAAGMRLASGHDDGTIHVWDLATGTEVAVLQGHRNWVRSLTAYADSDGHLRIASVSYDGTMRRWDPAVAGQVGPAVTAGAGQVAAITSWATPRGEPRIAVGNAEGVVQIHDGDTGDALGPPMTGHTGGIWALASWADPATGRTWVASSGYDGSVRLWDPDAGRALRTIEVGPVTMWAMSDAPADVDLLDREALAGAVADQLSTGGGHSGPAVISIEGSWGCGKTTLMEMIRDRLQTPPAARTSMRKRLTVAEAARAMRRPPATAASPPPMEVDRTVTAWFNPWAHQSGEQVWAGLTGEIVEAVAPALYPSEPERERYWLRRNLKRVDRFALERLMLRRIVSPVLGLALIAVAVPLALALARLDTPVEVLDLRMRTSAVAFVAAFTVLVAGLAHTAARYWFGRAARYLPGALLQGPSPADLPGEAEQVVDPLRRARAGALYLHQHDVGDLVRDLAAAGHRLVVFIDDLDRCRADTTVEVFEAVNLFLSTLIADGRPGVQFVIGVDPALIVDRLDEYANRLSTPPTGDDPSVGWAFLRKLVQLPVIVPLVRADGIRAFVDAATEPPPSLSVVPPRAIPAPRLPLPATPAPPPVPAPAAGVLPIARPAATIVPWRMLEQHPDIKQLLVERLAARPDGYIREAKRLLNTWQLLGRLVSATDPLADSAANLARGRHLVVLAEIVTRWPSLQGRLMAVADGERGLALLARHRDDDEQWAYAAHRLKLDRPQDAQALRNLRDLLRIGDPAPVAALAARLF